MLDVVSYDRTAQIAARSATLPEHQFPAVNMPQVIASRILAEGLFKARPVQRYDRAEPIVTTAEEGLAAATPVRENFPHLTPVWDKRVVGVLVAAAKTAQGRQERFAGLCRLIPYNDLAMWRMGLRSRAPQTARAGFLDKAIERRDEKQGKQRRHGEPP